MERSNKHFLFLIPSISPNYSLIHPFLIGSLEGLIKVEFLLEVVPLHLPSLIKVVLTHITYRFNKRYSSDIIWGWKVKEVSNG
jgi:hypothetical protein